MNKHQRCIDNLRPGDKVEVSIYPDQPNRLSLLVVAGSWKTTLYGIRNQAIPIAILDGNDQNRVQYIALGLLEDKVFPSKYCLPIHESCYYKLKRIVKKPK